MKSKVARVDLERRRAKGAIDADLAIIANHLLPFFRREAGDDRADIVGIAATSLSKRKRRERSHLVFFMEEPPQQIIERQIGIGQLLRFHRPAKDGNVGPIGMVEPRMKPLAPVLTFGDVLQE